MVDMMLYQSAYQFLKAYAGSEFGAALVAEELNPLFFGEIADSCQQIYVHQLQVIDIVLPFFRGWRAGIGPVATGR